MEHDSSSRNGQAIPWRKYLTSIFLYSGSVHCSRLFSLVRRPASSRRRRASAKRAKTRERRGSGRLRASSRKRRASVSEIGTMDRQQAAQPFLQEIFSPCFSTACTAIDVTASESA